MTTRLGAGAPRRGTTHASVIDESWADLAGVPIDWLTQLDANLGARRIVHAA